MPLSRTPTLAELLNAVKDSTLTDIRVAIPCRVESYDASTQLVDVQPLVSERVEVEDGVTTMQLPVITSVPLVFPGAGGFHITFPVKKGDEVLVIFTDKSIDAWQDQGGISDPDDNRRHHLSDAIAIPGLHNNTGKIAGVDTDVITIGKDDGDADFVALSTATKNELTKLHDTMRDGFQTTATAITAIIGHTHAVSGVAAAPSVALALLETPSGPSDVGDVNSSSVKIKG